MKTTMRTMAAVIVCIGLATACVTVENIVAPVAGSYQNNQAEADTTGKTITLNLFADKTCNMQTVKQKSGTKTETGTWSVSSRSVTVVLTDPTTPTVTRTLVFEKRMDKLVNKEWDKTIYGDAGFGTLKKK